MDLIKFFLVREPMIQKLTINIILIMDPGKVVSMIVIPKNLYAFSLELYFTSMVIKQVFVFVWSPVLDLLNRF